MKKMKTKRQAINAIKRLVPQFNKNYWQIYKRLEIIKIYNKELIELSKKGVTKK